MIFLSERAMLRFLSRRGHATAAEIGAACSLGAGEVYALLVMLEGMGHVVSRQEGVASPRRVYSATAEGRRAAGVDDARTS